MAYVPADPWECPGCKALEQEQDNVHEKARGPAVKFGLVPRSMAEAMPLVGTNGQGS